ncbi:MAG: hypothetical protein JWO84_505 [Parcubacteria group bacterium]|nr:hypothetical protein [Parcubacteria group bacterium]
MKLPDLDRLRSEKPCSLADFLKIYNADLPVTFPRASKALLEEFKETHASFFKTEDWSLDVHRKKVMDWLPARIAAAAR